jgi:uncharacterized Tic20 family protein
MANTNDIPEVPQNPPTGAGEPLGPAPVGPEPVEREPDKDARTWAMFAHLSALTGLFTAGVGFIVGPLVIWLIKKAEHPFVDDQGRESVNFQITMVIYGAIAFLLSFVCIGLILLPIVGIVDIVFTIIATIKANDGYRYRYPFPLIFRFIK